MAPVVQDSDRTVVWLYLSSLGSYSISDDAILDLIKIVLKDIPGFAQVTSFKSEKQTYGVIISLDIALYYGYDAQLVLYEAQQRVGMAVEEYTSITMNGVNVKSREASAFSGFLIFRRTQLYEKIYMIPVNDAYTDACGCPLCDLKEKAERNYLEYYLGPSLMEPDTRKITNQTGFCPDHMGKLNRSVTNRLRTWSDDAHTS